MNIKDYPDIFIDRCLEAISENGFGYETAHRLINNNWEHLKRHALNHKVYTGLCLGGW